MRRRWIPELPLASDAAPFSSADARVSRQPPRFPDRTQIGKFIVRRNRMPPMSITTSDASGSVGVPETMIAQMGELEKTCS